MPLLRRAFHVSDRTDFVALALGIFTGALIGISIVIPLGSVHIVLGTSVGTLLVGLVTGYLHSVRPLFGRIPDGAISFMSAIGLAAFVATIGLSAGRTLSRVCVRRVWVCFSAASSSRWRR